MVELNFTPEQRFIIALLCDLYKEPAKRELNPDFIMSAISGGHDWAFDWEYTGIFPEKTDTRDQVGFVSDTLDMWSFIEFAWPKLSPEDQKKVHAAVPYLGDGPKFIGFDGNYEVDYMAIARMLIEQMGRFSNLKGRSLNSHMPKVARYREMLAAWPEIRATLHAGDMSADQMIKLLSRD